MTSEAKPVALPAGCKMSAPSRYASDADCNVCGLGEGEACDTYYAVVKAERAWYERELTPVGEAAFMPGTNGFTLAVFEAAKVPVGTRLYDVAALAAAEQQGREAERERCAKLVDEYRPDASFDDSSVGYVERDALLKNIANAIRKGETE